LKHVVGKLTSADLAQYEYSGCVENGRDDGGQQKTSHWCGDDAVVDGHYDTIDNHRHHGHKHQTHLIYTRIYIYTNVYN